MSYKITSKKFLSFLMALLIALSMMVINVGAVSAEKPQEKIQNTNSSVVSPLWNNARLQKSELGFANGKIYTKIILSGIAGTKYRNGTVTISKYNGERYVPVKKWTGLSSTSKIFLFINSELSAISGVKYKLSITITAYTSSKSEVIKTSKVAICP